MKKVGEHLRRTMLAAALASVLAVALPVTAGAQLMDPVLEQYAPSTEQINKKVKEGDNQHGGGGGGGNEASTAAQEAGTVQGDAADTDGGSDANATGAGGNGSVGGGGGTGGSADGGSSVSSGGNGHGSQSGAGGSGLDARLLDYAPVTWFDLLAFAIAVGVLIGTVFLLRRLSGSPRLES